MDYKSKKQIFSMENDFIHVLVICIKKGTRRLPSPFWGIVLVKTYRTIFVVLFPCFLINIPLAGLLTLTPCKL